MSNDRPLAEADALARSLWRIRFADQDPHRIPRQCALMLSVIGQEIEQAEAGRYTQADFIASVIGQLEQMNAVDAAIARPHKPV
ncbi:hypothetical protein [Rhizobium sp. UGM030330-04]|uniref:hypothetical protein n=1 Tax=Pseudomonadota TaxID=1224 RepID=UPI000D83D45B|nr:MULTISPECIES: hypothetical protein [Pseudomonadota]PYG53441.1 hypothetical protein N434_04898 [Rhizobium sp. UGM030330-04]